MALSAATLILGLVLLFKKINALNNSKKHLYILAVMNVISILTFLFNYHKGYYGSWKEVVLFLDSIVLVLNMIMGYFVFHSWKNPESIFSKQIMRLFLISFLSVCILVILYSSSGNDGPLLDPSNDSFIGTYTLAFLLFIIGSLIPMISIIISTINKKHRLSWILVLILLNGLNNTAGLVFFKLEFPTKQFGIITNIIFNLLFAYAMAYYFLSQYFEERNTDKNINDITPSSFSWEKMKQHLNYWGELKSYVNNYYPDLINEVDSLPLSELEKTHLVLKKLNIKAKDIANAMNVSVKAIEMNRYRINVKLKSSDKN